MKISQRQARRLKKRVEELERERTNLLRNWEAPFSGTNLGRVTLSPNCRLGGRAEGAQMLKHVIVARFDAQTERLNLYAVRA